MPVRDAGLSFVNSISALTPHPSIHTLVFYASDCSKMVVLAVHDEVEKIFMCRFSFSTSAPTPAFMNVLGYRSRGWLLIMIMAPFGASRS